MRPLRDITLAVDSWHLLLVSLSPFLDFSSFSCLSGSYIIFYLSSLMFPDLPPGPFSLVSKYIMPFISTDIMLPPTQS